mgnify:CR=1 FL=1
MVRFNLQSIDGEDVGWIEFDPYDYEYTGMSAAVNDLLSVGPSEEIYSGDIVEAEDDSEQLNTVLVDSKVSVDTEYRVNEMAQKLEAHGLTVTEV